MDSTILSLLVDESFQRWIGRKASDEERQLWDNWLHAEPHHRELYTQALTLWNKAHFQPAALPDIDDELQKLQRRLELQTSRPIDLPAKAPVFGRKRSAHFSWARLGAFAVASTLLAFVLWRILPRANDASKPAMQVASTAYGERARINLPEGTTIILNANSSLRYPAQWDTKTRRRFELSGEAYFDVSSRPPGPQHDFTVSTTDGYVQVAGTRFVVHERGEGTRVVVEEGGVEVTVADTNSQQPLGGAQVFLNPGQLLQFQKGSRDLHPLLVSIGLYTTWWRDHLILKDTPFVQIVRRLEETYGVRVEVNNNRLLQRTLSGSIENQNLEVITEALAKALRVNVYRQSDVVVFSDLPKGKKNSEGKSP